MRDCSIGDIRFVVVHRLKGKIVRIQHFYVDELGRLLGEDLQAHLIGADYICQACQAMFAYWSDVRDHLLISPHGD